MANHMNGAAMVGFGIYGLVVLAAYIAVAIANGNLAMRLERNVAAWVVLSLIPLVNVFFYIYVFYVVLFFMIDRLKSLPPAQAR